MSEAHPPAVVHQGSANGGLRVAMRGAAARTDTFEQRFVAAPAAEQEQWAHQGRGAGIAAADTQARTFSDTSTAYLRASALDFDDGLEESLQTTLGTASDRDGERAIDSMLSRGLRAQSLSAGLVTGGTADGEPEQRVIEGVPAEHASQASLREQLRLARADRALAVGTQLNVPAPGAEDALYVSFKRKRIGGNQHTVEGVRAGAQRRAVKLKGLEHWSVVGGVLYGRSSPFTLEDLLRQARDRDANGTEQAGEPSEEVARLLKAGAEDPVLRMTASVYEPDDGQHAWDHELEDELDPQSEPEAQPQSQPAATTGSDSLAEIMARHLREHSSAVAVACGEGAGLPEHLAAHAAVALGERER